MGVLASTFKAKLYLQLIKADGVLCLCSKLSFSMLCTLAGGVVWESLILRAQVDVVGRIGPPANWIQHTHLYRERQNIHRRGEHRNILPVEVTGRTGHRDLAQGRM